MWKGFLELPFSVPNGLDGCAWFLEDGWSSLVPRKGEPCGRDPCRRDSTRPTQFRKVESEPEGKKGKKDKAKKKEKAGNRMQSRENHESS